MNLCTVSIFRLKLISLKQFHQFQFCHQSLHIFLLPPCAFLIVLEYLCFCECLSIILLNVILQVLTVFIFLYFHSSFITLCPLISLPSLPPLVSISPPDAGPQLCGVPVLLPTWAERLFPPGPHPGTNDRAVPGRRWPLPLIQPQQQVGGRTATRNNDHESSRALCTPWLQKFGLQL